MRDACVELRPRGRTAVTRAVEWGQRGDAGHRTRAFSGMMNTFWGRNVQHEGLSLSTALYAGKLLRDQVLQKRELCEGTGVFTNSIAIVSQCIVTCVCFRHGHAAHIRHTPSPLRVQRVCPPPPSSHAGDLLPNGRQQEVGSVGGNWLRSVEPSGMGLVP